ncbi:MAG TPA: glycosyltransferase family 39 protein [Candidatus Paceibacterota bacterium]|nr:glycosyltransferase family 39 protein [Candidatus Paceibacterota bacterium]
MDSFWGKLKEKRLMAIYLVLFFSFFLRFLLILKSNHLWWDQAIYIGMGKYLFSGGRIGYWENFRGPLWPILQGIIWKAGLDNIFWGKFLEVIFSSASVWLVYLIGEKIKKNVGLIAAILFGFTPFYFYLSAVGLTDIPSLFLALLAVYLVAAERPYLAGLSAALAFLTRFPEGLIVVPLGLAYFLEIYRGNMPSRAPVFHKFLYFLNGFLLLVIPYFLLNYLLYKEAFLPLLRANAAFHEYLFIYPLNPLFYLLKIPLENPLLLFALVTLFLVFSKRREISDNRIFLLNILILVIIGGYYFFIAPIKDLRYAIAFLPYLAIFAAYSIEWIFEKLQSAKPIMIIIGLILIMFILRLDISTSPYMKSGLAKDSATYNLYDHFKDRKTINSSSPFPLAYSDIKINKIFETWPQAAKVYLNQKGTGNYLLINSCDLICRPEDRVCQDEEKEFLTEVDRSSLKLYDATENSCHLLIYQMNQ